MKALEDMKKLDDFLLILKIILLALLKLKIKTEYLQNSILKIMRQIFILLDALIGVKF